MPCFLYLLTHQWTLTSFRVLTVINDAAVDTGVQVYLREWFRFRQVFCQKWIFCKGSYGSLNFLRDLHTVRYSGLSNLYICRECERVPSSPRPDECFSCLFDGSLSNGFEVASDDCGSLTISEAEDLFMNLLTISYEFGKSLFRSSAHFSINFFLLSFMSSLCILDINPHIYMVCE